MSLPAEFANWQQWNQQPIPPVAPPQPLAADKREKLIDTSIIYLREGKTLAEIRDMMLDGIKTLAPQQADDILAEAERRFTAETAQTEPVEQQVEPVTLVANEVAVQTDADIDAEIEAEARADEARREAMVSFTGWPAAWREQLGGDCGPTHVELMNEGEITKYIPPSDLCAMLVEAVGYRKGGESTETIISLLTESWGSYSLKQLKDVARLSEKMPCLCPPMTDAVTTAVTTEPLTAEPAIETGSVSEPVPDRDEIARAFNLLKTPGDVVELRSFNATDINGRTSTVAGFYTDPNELVNDTYLLSSNTGTKTKSVFWTIQQSKPETANNLGTPNGWKHFAKNGELTTDEQVVRYRFLPIDFDPARPGDTSSNAAEKQAALELATTVRDFLSAFGIVTALCDSGNGNHLLAAIDLEVSTASTELIKNILAGLSAKFGTAQVGIDTKVYNPSRIWKVYGTVARKGPHTVDRPWRVARILDLPALTTTNEETLRQLLAALPVVAATSNGFTKKPEGWLDEPFIHHNPGIDNQLASFAGYYIGTKNIRDPEELYVLLTAKLEKNGCFTEDGITPFTWNDARVREIANTKVKAWGKEEDYKPGHELVLNIPSTVGAVGVVPTVTDEITEDPNADVSDLVADIGNPDAPFDIDYFQTSMARLTLRLYGDKIRFVVIQEKGDWKRFNGKYWVNVNVAKIRELIRKSSRVIREQLIPSIVGEKEYVDKKKELCQKLISACHDITFTSKVMTWMQEHQTPLKQFDKQDMKVNFANGTWNAETGVFGPFDPKDYSTQIMSVNFNPNATCPTFLKMLENAFDNPEMPKFLIRYMGYCMLGTAQEKCFILMHGKKDNGKTTLLEVLAAILGDYAKKMEWDALSKLRSGQIRNDLACLHNARFVYADEGDKDIRIAEEILKMLTSGIGKLSARFLNKEFFEFVVKFTMVLSANDPPKLSSTDLAIWERVLDVNMKKTFSRKDPRRIPHLHAKLLTEKEGIAQLMVKGALDFLKNGLQIPDEVVLSTEAYRQGLDPVQEFLSDCEVGDPDADDVTERSLVHSTYQQWAEKNDRPKFGIKEFTSRMEDRGFKKTPSNNPRGWIGIKLAAGMVFGHELTPAQQTTQSNNKNLEKPKEAQ
jgi:P4 family phage/plasmid primase-like protien